jgi:hypothetical protein
MKNIFKGIFKGPKIHCEYKKTLFFPLNFYFCEEKIRKIKFNTEQSHLITKLCEDIEKGNLQLTIYECEDNLKKYRDNYSYYADNDLLLFNYFLSYAYYEKQDYEKAMKYSLITLDIIYDHDSQYEPHVDKIYLQINKQLAKCYYLERQFIKSIEFGLEAVKLAEFFKDSILQAKLCLLIADNFQELENFEDCFKFLKKSSDIFILTNSISNLIDLSFIYLKIAKKRIKKNKEFTHKLVSIVEEMRFFIDKNVDLKLGFDFYFNLAGYYHEDQEMEKAAQCYEICLDLIRKQLSEIPDNEEYEKTNSRILEILAEINIFIGKIKVAENYLEELLLKKKNLRWIPNLHKDIYNLLQCYINNNNLTKFSTLFKEIVLFSFDNQLINETELKDIFDNYSQLIEIKVKDKKFEEAIEILEKYKKSIHLFKINNKRIAIEFIFTAAKATNGKDSYQKSIDYILKENLLNLILDVENIKEDSININLMRYYAFIADNYYHILQENKENKMAKKNCKINAEKAMNIAVHYKNSINGDKCVELMEEILDSIYDN